MKIRFEDDVPLDFDGGHWDEGKKDILKLFLRDLNLNVCHDGGDIKLYARSWKEMGGMVHVNACPDDMAYATIYSSGLEYSGIVELNSNRYQVEIKKERMRIKDSVLEMSVDFSFK